jgi:hypothetical protein
MPIQTCQPVQKWTTSELDKDFDDAFAVVGWGRSRRGSRREDRRELQLSIR